jgi:YbbR domain-containing protein
MKLLKGSFLLKTLALFSAIVMYVFIHNEMYNIRTTGTDPSYKLLKLTAKSLPLKVRLGTEPPEGYQIVEDQVAATPSHVIVIGPEALLEEAGSAETALIDVSESTKTVTKRIPLESVAGTHLTGAPYTVEVVVPIRKVEPDAAPTAAPPA